MDKKLDLSEKIVSNTVGKMFTLASDRLPCYELTFCKAWLSSDVCASVAAGEGTVICQSSLYLFNSLMTETELPVHEGHVMYQDAMFWFGYLTTYWMYLRGISGKDILEQYDIRSILERYDTFHTMSVKAAIKSIEQECTKAEVIKNSILYG